MMFIFFAILTFELIPKYEFYLHLSQLNEYLFGQK